MSRRNAISAFAVVFAAAVGIFVAPGSDQLPGDATASAIVTIGAAAPALAIRQEIASAGG